MKKEKHKQKVMTSKSCLEIAFIFGLVLVCTNAEGKIFNVLSYGAKADGVTDDSKVRTYHFIFLMFL